MVIDSHVHLLDPRLRERAEGIVNNLKSDGVECVVEISADFAESREALDFAGLHGNVFCTVGVHPIFADGYSSEFEKWVIAQNGNNKIVAIGECGLDYFHGVMSFGEAKSGGEVSCHNIEKSKAIQRNAFVSQIKLADRMGLPLVVHTRNAFDDTFEILSEYREFLNNGLVLHCFSGGAFEVERFMTFDCYFAFGGAITYKNSVLAAEAVRAVPRDRLMIETDCPYLAPVPLRGSINEPKNVNVVAENIAGILGLDFEEAARITMENTKRFYRI